MWVVDSDPLQSVNFIIRSLLAHSVSLGQRNRLSETYLRCYHFPDHLTRKAPLRTKELMGTYEVSTENESEEEIQARYQYWRIRIFYSMFVGYALFYLTRKSFTLVMPVMIADLGFDKAQVGWLGTVLALSYGMSKFVSGILADRSNPRYFMACGLIITGMLNILFGMSSSITFFAIFWGLNGWFQGFGFPPCASLMTHWYSHSERGSWWSSWNTSHNLGSNLIRGIVMATLLFFSWRWGMYIPGVLCILGGIFLINRLRNTPESVGLPPIEKFRNDYVGSGVKPGEESKKLTTKEVLFTYVLANPFIWLLGVSYFFVYFVRTSIDNWVALFLMEHKAYSFEWANVCASAFEWGGIAGGISAGWISDRLFGAKRGPVNALFALLMFVSVFIFWATPAGFASVDSAALFLVGFSVFGPQMLIGVHAAELAHKKAAATSTGFIGWFAYLGAAVAGGPFGQMIENMGWTSFFWVVCGCCLISFLLLIPLWSATDAPSLAEDPVRSSSTDPEYA